MTAHKQSVWLRNIAVVSSCFYLVACGGGSSSSGDGNSPSVAPTVTNHAEGLYLESNTVRLQKINFVIKENVFFGITGTTDSTGQMFAADGVFAGLGASTNGTYTANLNYFNSKNTLSGTLTASDAKPNTLSGTLIVGGVSQPLTADAPSSAAYTYTKAASLQDVSGDWTLNRTVKLTVNTSGLISGSDSMCTFSGFFLPDPGKNIFLVNVVFAKSLECGASAGAEAKGLATTYLLSNGKRQLLIMAQGTAINTALGMAGVR
jgi:hypothetical protein